MIYLEGNGFGEIRGLEKCKLLRCLYLQENLIKKIEGLDHLEDLDTLNLNQNCIKTIENLSRNTKLNTLTLQKNKITTVSDIEHLTECKHLSVLDLSQNYLSDPAILDVLEKMPCLKVLYLKGNPLVKTLKNFRKTVISRCKQLTYLDDRPIFEDERRTADAWGNGGTDAEKKERDVISEEKKRKEREQFEWFGSILEKARKEKTDEDCLKAETAAAATADFTAANTEEDETKTKIADETSSTSSTSSKISEVSQRDEKIASEEDEVPPLEHVGKAESVSSHSSEDYVKQEEKQRSSTDSDEYIKAEEKRVSSQDVSEEEEEEEEEVPINITKTTKPIETTSTKTVKQAFGTCRNSYNPYHECTDFCQQFMQQTVSQPTLAEKETEKEEELVFEDLSEDEEEDLPPMPDLEQVDENDVVVGLIEDEVDEIDELD